MVRRVSVSQYNSMVRQANAQRRQAINKFNNAINQVNRERRRFVDNYNREVSAHNARVRADRQRLKSALTRFEQEARKPVKTQITYKVTTRTLHSSYVRLEERASSGYYSDDYNDALDLAEREAANSLDVANAFDGVVSDESDPEEMEPDEGLLQKLSAISSDLCERWKGALFSLSPRNPDAARHFCTSAREIFTQIFASRAPDALVLAARPDCARTSEGKPTRRSKIEFFLSQQQLSDEALERFVDEDMENILSLFQTFNDGTHGSAGRFALHQLLAVKRRVEDGLNFLVRFAVA